MDLIEVSKNKGIQRHPWEIARGRFFGDCLMEALKKSEANTLLDVGSGDGYMAHVFEGRTTDLKITCWDINYKEDFLEQARRLYPGIEFTPEQPSGIFDMFTMLDVLEHVDDDVGFLTDLVTHHLIEGGHALICVPAWPFLFSDHDSHLKHFRRYTPKAARALIGASGLKILKSGGLFHSLLLPRTLGVAKEKIFGATPPKGLSDWKTGSFTTSLIQGVLSGDNWLSKGLGNVGLSLPGLSWWALCQK